MTSINGVLFEVQEDVRKDLQQNEVQICGVHVDRTQFDGIYSCVAFAENGAVFSTLIRKIGPDFEKLADFKEVKKNA